VQFCGKNVLDYLQTKNPKQFSNSKKNKDEEYIKNEKSRKYNLHDDKAHHINSAIEYSGITSKARTRVFYCTHFNRNNAFFKRHDIVKDSKAVSAMDKADDLFKKIFGPNRIRKDLRNNIINILIFMIEKVKTFNFNHYLNKS